MIGTKRKKSAQSIYAILLFFGAGILLYRTVSMILFEQAFQLLVLWVIILLIIEFLIDLACMISSARWFISNERSKGTLALRFGAAATILHAFRVLIYVLGRTGPWHNFDVKPDFKDSYTFDWFWVYFAAILAFAGVMGVIIIWFIIRVKKTRN